MKNPSPQGSLVQFSSNDFPLGERVEAFREVYGRAILSVEYQPHKDTEFHQQMNLRALPDLGIGHGLTSAATYRRTCSLRREDELLFFVFLGGQGSAIQGRRETPMSMGQATLLSGEEVGATIHPTRQEYMSFALSGKMLSSRVHDVESLLARPILAQSETLQLLIGYTRALQHIDLTFSPYVRQMVSTHIYDLAASILGSTSDEKHIAENRGVRAARLRAIKADIATNLASRELTVDAVARRQGISTRYVRALFESEETTFTDFVLSARLNWTHQLLMGDPSNVRHVRDIAQGAGFSALSYFNHSFRRKFGMTPSDVRAAARLRSI